MTALIGPAGWGKSTFLRCINRMNDIIESARVGAELLFHGTDGYDDVDPVALPRKVGMVVQEPNPFPKSIRDNIAQGLRVRRFGGNVEDRVERTLKDAALWEDVHDQPEASGPSCPAARGSGSVSPAPSSPTRRSS